MTIQNNLTDNRAGALKKDGGRIYPALLFFLIWTYIGIGRPQDIFFFLRPLRLALVSIILTAGAAFAAASALKKNSVLNCRESKIFIAFVAWTIITIAFGHNRRMGYEYFVNYYVVNVVYFFFAVYLIRNIHDVKSVIWTLILSSFGLCLASLIFSEGEQRIAIAGGANDPNDLALLAVTSLPMIVYFMLREKGLKKIFLIGSLVISVAAIVMTFSRGGFLGLLAVSFLILIRRTGFKSQFIKYAAAAIAVILFLSLTPASFWDRIGSITEEMHVDVTDEADQFSRKTIWMEGLELFYADPVAGVGFGAFSDALAYYRLEAGGIPKYQTAHNSYVLVLTETGIVGFGLYMALIASSILTFRRIRRSGSKTGSGDEISVYANLLEISMWGWLVSAFFLSQSYSSMFLLFPALAAIMREKVLPDYVSRQESIKEDGYGLSSPVKEI